MVNEIHTHTRKQKEYCLEKSNQQGGGKDGGGQWEKQRRNTKLKGEGYQ